MKTEVPGLETNGKGSFVQKDRSKYHEMVARRKEKLAIEEARRDVESLRQEMRELKDLILSALEAKR
jgi:hypothetical protein